MRRSVVFILILLFLGNTSLAQTEGTYTTIDESFTFTYPPEWQRVDTTVATTVLGTTEDALYKGFDEFETGEMQVQVMSPTATQKLLGIELGMDAYAVTNGLLSRLQTTFQTQGDPIVLQLGDKTVVRTDLAFGSVDVMLLAVDAGDGGVALMFAFMRGGERPTMETALYTVAASMSYRKPLIDPTTLLPITATNTLQVRALAIWGGHTDWVRSVAISPDGLQLASISGNLEFRLWEMTTGTSQIVNLGGRAVSAGPTYSPDGTQLAFGSLQGEVWIWDIAANTITHEFEAMSEVIWSIEFSADGTQLAAASGNNTIRVWNLTSGEMVYILEGHEDGVSDVAFSPDGTKLTTSSFDGTVRIWDLTTGETIHEITQAQVGLTSIAFSPDGTSIGAGTINGNAYVWSVETGEGLFSLQGDQRPITAVTFNLDGSIFAASSEAATIRMWSMQSGVPLLIINSVDNVNGLAFSTDGKLLIGANNSGMIVLWGVRQ